MGQNQSYVLGINGTAHKDTISMHWHMTTRIHRCSKWPRSTPTAPANAAPHSESTTFPKFVIDMSVAYREPSTPSGHTRAPKTTIGSRIHRPTSVKTIESAVAIIVLDTPKLIFLISNMWDHLSVHARSKVPTNNGRNATPVKYFL